MILVYKFCYQLEHSCGKQHTTLTPYLLRIRQGRIFVNNRKTGRTRKHRKTQIKRPLHKDATMTNWIVKAGRRFVSTRLLREYMSAYKHWGYYASRTVLTWKGHRSQSYSHKPGVSHTISFWGTTLGTVSERSRSTKEENQGPEKTPCEDTRGSSAQRSRLKLQSYEHKEMGFSITWGRIPDRGNMPSKNDKITAFRPARFWLVEALDSLYR